MNVPTDPVPTPAEAAGERRARVVLSRIAEPGDPRLTTLVAELGATAVLESLREQTGSGSLGGDLADRLRDADPDTDLELADRRGIRFVTPADAEWPPSLCDLASGPFLHRRGGIPVGLWVKGPLRLADATRQAVAVVGSRSATTYGADVAGEIGATLAESSKTVISGAAFGIDQAAHRGALAARGPTVAVLACGADRVYPQAHEALLAYIADVGLVISEAAPGFAPTRVRFLARNRLIAALGTGTVVVEAAVRSGALNTAQWADGLHRTVMGVPGPVTSAPSQGVHLLIRERAALLVTGGRDVLDAVSEAGEHVGKRPQGLVKGRDRLTDEQRQVLDGVPARSPGTVPRIARAAGIAQERVAETLQTLLKAGLVEHSGGRWRLAIDDGLPIEDW